MKLDLEIGDIVLGGKFKNKRMKVKTLGVDDLGQPTINGRGLLKVRIEKLMPREKWSAKTREESEKKVKITEKQLRNLVKQTLNESSDKSYNMMYNKAPMPVKSRADAEFARLIKEESRESSEGKLQAELSQVIDSIREIAEGMYGLQDPGEPGLQAGDELAGDLELQVERLDAFFDQLEGYFLSMDDAAGRNPGGSIG